MRHLLSSLATSSVIVALCVCSCGGDDSEYALPPQTGGHAGAAGADSSPESTGKGGSLIPFDGATDESASPTDACLGDACADDAGPVCGNGKVDLGEKCDDNNTQSGDGCTANCDAIEQNFACPEPGKPCVSTMSCGDGKVSGSETCDDKNTKPGDGCDATCKVEAGWKCLVPGAACEAAQCGDGIIAGHEQCDDGDAEPGDGCDALCQLEPGWVCKEPGKPCVETTCGDGIPEGSEQCDDANHDLGDGCTPFCQREPNCTAGACTSACGDGMMLPGDKEECDDGNTVAGDGCSPTCTKEPGYACPTLADNPTELVLPIVIRDFTPTHLDFESALGNDLGIVADTPGADGKPVYANPGGTTPTTHGVTYFDLWYRDDKVNNPPLNTTILQSLTLTKLSTGVFRYDNSSFFPIDGQGFGDYGTWGHNFHFTSEVRYWFQYKGGEQLDFTGDDDVFVFINHQLVVDLGGVHGAASGGVTLDGTWATQLGLEVDKIYESVVFQAERHTSESNYRLTLSNFVRQRSDCKSVCGDGIVTPDEVCDDGVNDGKYGGCTKDCKRAPFCGDGQVQASEGEQCDDGVNLSPYNGCAPGCVNGGSCGDGKVDSLFGEKCDDGVNDGGYGECDKGCVLGPRCGDGVVQKQYGEECDDGNHVGGDGCSANCRGEGPK